MPKPLMKFLRGGHATKNVRTINLTKHTRVVKDMVSWVQSEMDGPEREPELRH